MSDDGSDDGGFVRRWSRLKRATGEKAETPDLDLEAAAVGGDLALDETPDDGQSDEELKEIAAEDLPDIDSLQADSDFTPFMQAGVPEKIKNLALRKLWRSDPILANVDGLNDYDDDFKAAMEIGTAFIEKARAEGVKFIGEHPDEPEEAEVQDLVEAEPEEAPETDEPPTDDAADDPEEEPEDDNDGEEHIEDV